MPTGPNRREAPPDSVTEVFSLTTYGSPLLQAMVGHGSPMDETRLSVERDLVRETTAGQLQPGLDSKFEQGGVEEVVLGALICVRKPEGGFDERGCRMMKSIREPRKSNERLSLERLREMLNEQLQLVVLDEERAIAALRNPLQSDDLENVVTLDGLGQIAGAAAALNSDGKRGLARVEKLFGARLPPSRSRKVANV